MRQAIETAHNAYELLLTLELGAPARQLNVRGFDTERDWSCYFDRRIYRREQPPLPPGPLPLAFPLPVSPRVLDVMAVATGERGERVPVRLAKCEWQPLPTRPVLTNPLDTEWLAFATYLAVALPQLELTQDPRFPYQSDNGHFMVRLLDRIRNRETGKVLPTPARINHTTSIMELAVEQMLPYTIPMRLVIMLHEYIHLRDRTTDELACDRGALELFTAAGYPLSEGLAAFSRVFEKRPVLQQRVREAARQLQAYDQQYRIPEAGPVAIV